MQRKLRGKLPFIGEVEAAMLLLSVQNFLLCHQQGSVIRIARGKKVVEFDTSQVHQLAVRARRHRSLTVLIGGRAFYLREVLAVVGAQAEGDAADEEMALAA